MIQFAYSDSPLGTVQIGHRDDTIVSIKCVDHPGADHRSSPVSDLAAAQLREYFEGTRKSFDLSLSPMGTEFQKSVWNALTQIPYGETRSYGEIAAAVGNPNAARAVGMACSRNPIWIAIPCHRVVGKNASLTGYAGGLGMKRALLELEQHNA